MISIIVYHTLQLQEIYFTNFQDIDLIRFECYIFINLAVNQRTTGILMMHLNLCIKFYECCFDYLFI